MPSYRQTEKEYPYMNHPNFFSGKAALSLVMCACLACAGLTGCSGGGDTPAATTPVSVAPSTVPATQATVSDIPALEETVIFSAEGITVTATGLRDGLLGPEISVSILNETDVDIVVSSRSLSVNGFMLSASGLYSEVAAGKKALASMNLLSSELEEAGITAVAEAAFYLNIYSADTFEDVASSGLITLPTSVSGSHSQAVNDAGQVLLEEAGIRVVSQGLRNDILWDGCLVLYLENNSGETVNISAEKISVNGIMVTDSLFCELRPETRRVDGIYLLNLEELGITDLSQVENLEFSLRVTDELFRDLLVTEPISLSFT